MTKRAKQAGRCCKASSAFIVLAVLTSVLLAAGNAAASSPATTAAKTGVSWKWILVGIGGAVILLALMWLLQRGIQRKGKK